MNETTSVRKNALDINCLTTGNTLLIKIDNVSVIQNQFDKFLEKIVNNEKTIHDSKLPNFIISSFSRLFQNWLMYPELNKLISSDLFRDVFLELSKTFEPEKPSHGVEEKRHVYMPPEHSYFTIYCNECDEKLKIVNDDVQLSYDLHFQDEHPESSHVSRSSSISGTLSDVKAMSASVSDLGKENCVPSVSNIPKLLDLNLNLSPRSWRKPQKEKVELKLPSAKDRFCEPCCKMIRGSQDTISSHKNSASHKKQVLMFEKSQQLLKKFKNIFVITNQSSFEFLCKICDKKQSGTNCFIQHCRAKTHLENALKVGK